MAAPAVEEKALKPAPVSALPTTANAHDDAASEMTPLSGSVTPCNEKQVKEMHHELSRNSTVSTPSTVHQLNPFDTDIEAIMPRSTENLGRKSTTMTSKPNPDCPVWPGQNHWKQKARDAKLKNRSCQCMARLSKRTRLLVKILIGLLIVGIAVGVGLGISKSLGAAIWRPKDP